MRYLIQIKAKGGKKLWLSFKDKAGPYAIYSKSAAEVFTNHQVAQICSDYFWKNRWDDERFENREIVYYPKKA